METPNLDYINKLARGSDAVKKTLIEVIKKEFPEEKDTYFNSKTNQDFKNIEDDVHRIKHKFSILGLEKSYKNAVDLELKLRERVLDEEKIASFEKTLQSITIFLKTI